MTDPISVRREAGKIVIELSEDMLLFAARSAPVDPILVVERENFLDFICRNIASHGDTGDRNSQPALFSLIDAVMVSAVENDAGAVMREDQ